MLDGSSERGSEIKPIASSRHLREINLLQTPCERAAGFKEDASALLGGVAIVNTSREEGGGEKSTLGSSHTKRSRIRGLDGGRSGQDRARALYYSGLGTRGW